jgi:hypothetical protein
MQKLPNVTEPSRMASDGVMFLSPFMLHDAGPESGKTKSVVRSLKPGPQIFLDTESFVKGRFVRFVGMSKLGVKKSLSQITGALKPSLRPWKRIRT